MSRRRLIGIDLAWGQETGTDYYSTDCEGSGCAELAWDGKDLTLKRLALLHSMDEIVDWIKPDCGAWVAAVDVPIVIRNEKGRRPAEDEADEHYRPYQAVPRPSHLNLPVGKSQRRGQLLTQLQKSGGELVEQAAALKHPRLVFETYPHIAMVELFNLGITIKYKKDWISRNCAQEHRRRCRNEGQQWLAEEICEHLHFDAKKPRLLMNKRLKTLLREPASELMGKELKNREDKLDAVVCAYTAAWLDAKRDLVGLGKVGEGVMIMPRLREIGPPLR